METTFSKQLQKFRKQSGITQEQLADRLGVTAQAVSKWENGSYPDGDLLPKIADIFDVSIDNLYGRGEEKCSFEQQVLNHMRAIADSSQDSSAEWLKNYLNIIWAMQQLGAKTGAQTVISGTFKPLGTLYVLDIQAFDVTTATIQDTYRSNVVSDETLELLTKKKIVGTSGKIQANDYTAGERLGIGFQNILLGLGSYRNGHWGDGILMTAADVGKFQFFQKAD